MKWNQKATEFENAKAKFYYGNVLKKKFKMIQQKRSIEYYKKNSRTWKCQNNVLGWRCLQGSYSKSQPKCEAIKCNQKARELGNVLTIFSYENALHENIQKNQTYQEQKDGIKKKKNF
jgi:hypothetical protein